MSFGFPLRNGAPVGLASIAGFGKRVAAFSPASLFTGGVQGAWYDPSDYTTLFQDAAGTTPVTAVEQPVGLMLDKSQGLVLGPELVITPYGGAASGGWGFSGNTVTRDGVTAGGVCNLAISARSSAALRCQITFTVSGLSGDTFSMQSATGNVGNISTNGTKSFIFDTASTTSIRFIAWGGGAGSVVISNISVKELPGNHASQATSTSRPVLRARYNLLTYSEQFDNAAWGNVVNVSVSQNSTTAPNGTLTADTLVESAASGVHFLGQVVTVSNGTFNYTISVYAKKKERDWLCLGQTSGTVSPVNISRVWFNLANGTVGTASSGYTGTIQDVGNGWYRCVATASFTISGGAIIPFVGISTADNQTTYTGDGTSGIYVWGAQLSYGSSAGTYQRIAAATDYDTAGFLPYLAFDGSDDSMSTASINFTGGDAMSVFAGVTKLSDAAQGVIAELSATIASNNGTFLLTAPNSAAANYNFSSKGTAQADATTGSVYAAPTTDVLTGQADISSDTLTLRIDGVPAASSTTDQGTGNYGNYPLYIGRRNNASLPFNGRLYSLIVAGKTVSASELASTEAYVAAKTGVTL